jgi:SOS-response transcriptional repressor LexA
MTQPRKAPRQPDPARRPAVDADIPERAPLDDAAPHPDEERLADWLVRVVGDRLRDADDQVDPDDPVQARYHDWLAREARAAQSPAERAHVARAAATFAREALARRGHDGDGSSALARIEGAPVAHAPASRARGLAAVREASLAGYAPLFALGVAAGTGRELWDEAAESWLELPPGAAAGQNVALTVRGDSMSPMMHDGDTILVRLGGDAAPGDVVVARRPDDGYVVKRVARVEGDAMVLASSNAAYADVEIPNDPSLVVGVVRMIWCAHGAAPA